MNFEYLEVRKGRLPPLFQSFQNAEASFSCVLDNYSYLDFMSSRRAGQAHLPDCEVFKEARLRAHPKNAGAPIQGAVERDPKICGQDARGPPARMQALRSKAQAFRYRELS